MTVDEQRPGEADGETLRIDNEAPPAPEGPGSFGFEEDRPAFPSEEDHPAIPVDEDHPAIPVDEDPVPYKVEEVPDAYAERPELYAGGAFVGGFLLAKLIGRFGRG